MDFTYLLKDALKYPLSDFKKFLILAIPNLILQVIVIIFAAVFLISTNMFENLSNYQVSSGDIMSLGIMVIIFYLIAFIVSLINGGITIETVKKSFTSSELIDFDISRFFVSGLKKLILSIGYILIPMLVLLFIGFLGLGLSASMADTNMEAVGGIIFLLVILIIIVALVFVYILSVVATGRLAETNSLSEAYDFKNIYNIAKRIGFFNIFCIELLLVIITIILSVVMTLVAYIPIIGSLIYGLYSTYLILAASRLVSLIYQHKQMPQNMNYPNQPQISGSQQGYPNSNNQVQGGYTQVPGGYYPPQQGYQNPEGLDQQNSANYQQQDLNQPQQGMNQNNPSQGYGDSQNYYNPGNQNINQDNNNQDYQKDDSIIKDKTGDVDNQNDLDFKNTDSSDEN
jgi:hypothetical protein